MFITNTKSEDSVDCLRSLISYSNFPVDQVINIPACQAKCQSRTNRQYKSIQQNDAEHLHQERHVQS